MDKLKFPSRAIWINWKTIKKVYAFIKELLNRRAK